MAQEKVLDSPHGAMGMFAADVALLLAPRLPLRGTARRLQQTQSREYGLVQQRRRRKKKKKRRRRRRSWLE